MIIRRQDSGRKVKYTSFAYFLPFVLCLAACAIIASTLYAQEKNEEDNSIELPPVKIEVVDTTRLDIPRERFRSFTKPDPRIYAPSIVKERPWYVPSTSIPEKIGETAVGDERNSLFSLTAQFGNPQALAYQALLVKGFGNSDALLDVGRATLWSERTAQLVGNSSNGLGDSTIDRAKASFAHQVGNSSLKVDVHYDVRRLGYLDKDGAEYPNDRSLMGLLAGWDQVLPGNANARSAVNFSISSLKANDPLSAGYEKGLELGTGLGLRAMWPGSNPVDAGMGIEYFASDIEATDSSPARNFSETILRLSLRDNHIQVGLFVLGISMELMLDARKGSPGDDNWELGLYPMPCVSFTSLIGDKTTLRLSAERQVLGQDSSYMYLENDYMRYNPELPLEKTWGVNVNFQSRLTPVFTVTADGFGKEIRDLTVFEEAADGILSWRPASRNKARIYGFRSGWDLSLMEGRIKQSLEYVHEEHDQEIPYRPNDQCLLTITCEAPFELELSVSGKFCGTRYVSANMGDATETLSSYFLWEPRISRNFGKYASVFLTAGFYFGRDDYQVWKGYGLPDQTVDFGLTLKL